MRRTLYQLTRLCTLVVVGCLCATVTFAQHTQVSREMVAKASSKYTITVINKGNGGRHNAIAIMGNGFPATSYYNDDNGEVEVAICLNKACTLSTTKSLASADFNTTDIAAGTDGFPVVVYPDPVDGKIYLSVCNNEQCSSFNKVEAATFDSNGSTDPQPSLMVANGEIVIAYNENSILTVVNCSEPDYTCGTPMPITLNDGYYDRDRNAIVAGTDGMPVIAYYIGKNNYGRKVGFVRCTTMDCSAYSYSELNDYDTDYGGMVDVAVTTDNFPVVIYYDADGALQDINMVQCLDVDCTTHNTATVVSSSDAMDSMSIVLKDNMPWISYSKNNSHDNGVMYVATCKDAACAAVKNTKVDHKGDLGRESDLALGTDGKVVMSYSSEKQSSLRVAHKN